MMARVLVSPERIEYKAVENAELVGEWFSGCAREWRWVGEWDWVSGRVGTGVRWVEGERLLVSKSRFQRELAASGYSQPQS